MDGTFAAEFDAVARDVGRLQALAMETQRRLSFELAMIVVSKQDALRRLRRDPVLCRSSRLQRAVVPWSKYTTLYAV